MPPGGLNIRSARLNRHALEKEELLHRWRRPAALAFLRENGLNRIMMGGGPHPRLGIVSLGKSWLDTLGALDLLGIDEKRAADLGLRLYKVAAPWPLEPEGVNRFAEGLKTILVVEEKRSLVETQLKEQLYGRANAPMVIGKKRRGRPRAAAGLGRARRQPDRRHHRRAASSPTPRIRRSPRGSKQLEHAQAVLAATEDVGVRVPHFCSGCPHNTSTQVPEGSRAYAGIGCHYMALWMDRAHRGLHADGRGGRQLDRRGAVLQARATSSRTSATAPTTIPARWRIRAAAAAGVNITYKILYNDAVAMTGGQPVEGSLTVDQVARQVGGRRREAHRDRHRRSAQISGERRLARGRHHPSPLGARGRAARRCAR